jgi:hypothetical protein
LFPKWKKPFRGKRFRSIEEVSNDVTRVIRRINNEGVLTAIQDLPKCWDRCDNAQWRLHWRPVKVFCKINSFLKTKHTVCRTSEMAHLDEYRRNWLSHLRRMLQNRITLKSYHYRPQGKRTIGRPKKLGENSCRVGDATDQSVQSLMFMMIMMMLMSKSLLP